MFSYFKRIMNEKKIINDYKLQAGIHEYKCELSFTFKVLKQYVSKSYAKQAVITIASQSKINNFDIDLDENFRLIKQGEKIDIINRSEY